MGDSDIDDFISTGGSVLKDGNQIKERKYPHPYELTPEAMRSRLQNSLMSNFGDFWAKRFGWSGCKEISCALKDGILTIQLLGKEEEYGRSLKEFETTRYKNDFESWAQSIHEEGVNTIFFKFYSLSDEMNLLMQNLVSRLHVCLRK